jgi:hypothetical protein
VELESLSVQDFEAILMATTPRWCASTRRLLATEGVALEFTPEGITRLAHIAFEVNERTENIGARRLSTVMERLLDEVSFDAAHRSGPNGAHRRRLRGRAPAGAEPGRRPLALHSLRHGEKSCTRPLRCSAQILLSVNASLTASYTKDF